MTAQKFWGYHVSIDAGGCDPEAIRSSNHIARFTRDLVERIDMVAWGEPQIVHFGSGNKAGYTLVQLIETSNICAHFTEEDDCMYLDVFSCKEFKTEDVIDVVKEFFDPIRIKKNMITRQA